MRVASIVGATVMAVLATACAPDPPEAVVGVVVDSCDPGQEVGSGVFVGDGLVLTSAHVVAGADEIVVRRAGTDAVARVVAFDPEMDLAYLAVDAVGHTPTLEIASAHVERGDAGRAYVVRAGEVVAVPVTVRRRVNIRTEDIYIQGETNRPGFELDAEIEAGDSGAALVVAGKVVGVIWARSNKYERRAYAIDPVRAGDLVAEQLRTGDLGDDVDITRCH